MKGISPAMRVLHAAETIKGGVATVMRTLVEAQRQSEGISQVRAIVPANQAAEMGKKTTDNVYTFHRSGRNLKSFASFVWVVSKGVWQFNPDIVHLHSTFAGVLGRIVLLCMRPWRNPKVIYCPHAWSFIMEGSSSKKLVFGQIERLLAPLADAIICVSEYEKDAAKPYKIPENNIHVVYNGVDIPSSIPTKPKKSKMEPIELLFVGRFDHQKGFDIVIELMRQLEGKPFHLTAVGAPVHANEAPAPRENITYTGWLKPDELKTYYAKADVLLMPSRWESFGLVAAEAQAYGTAVVATDCCSLPEVIEHGKTGYLFNHQNLDAAINFLETTPREKWLSMGREGYTRTKERFDARDTVKNTLKIYGKPQ
jgi:glycosyltransferase involved in cell wall biosynthesis